MSNIKKLEDLGFRISDCSIKEIEGKGWSRRIEHTIILEEQHSPAVTQLRETALTEKTLGRIGNNILNALKVMF